MNFIIYDLKCEYRNSPLGVSEKQPRFSWKIKSDTNGTFQTAYKISVTNSNDNVIWDSGKIISADCFAIKYDGDFLTPFNNYSWCVTVWDNNDKPATSEKAAFSTGVFSLKDWSAKWITAKNANGPIHARTAFEIQKKVKSAYLYSATTTGAFGNMSFCVNTVYLTLNGKKVGKDNTTPGQLSEKKWRALYRTYDVTNMLNIGKNAIGVVLLSMAYSCLLKVTYESGDTEDFNLSDNFKVNGAGPYTLWDEGVEDQGGKKEDYNSLKEYTHFDTPDFDDGDWNAPVFTHIVASLEEQTVTTEEIEVLKPVSITSYGYRHHIVDFGQNINGHIRLTLKNPQRGKRISIAFAEALYENGELNAQSTINYQRGENGPHCDTYIAKGEEIEIFEPKFANHGFRYIDIVAMPTNITADDVEAVMVHSPILSQSSFECSDKDLNDLYNISYRSQRTNLSSIPTDCPTRERHGWLGDAWVVCESECISFDLYEFFRSWFKSIRDDQSEDGFIPCITPFQRDGVHNIIDTPWSFAAVTMPLMVYKYYGDEAVLEEMYPVIAKWIDFLKEKINNEGILEKCALWNDHTAKHRTDLTWLGTLYFLAALKCTVEICEILNKATDEYLQLITATCNALVNKYKNSNGFANGFQNDLAHAFCLQLDNSETLKAQLIESVEKENYHFTGGCLGIYYLIEALEKLERNDIIYKMLKQDDEHTFLNWIRKYDATTAFEFLKYNDWVTRNHPFLMGSTSRWLYEALAGIKATDVGYKAFSIKPYFPETVNYIKCKIDTNYGVICLNCKKSSKEITYEIDVPCGTEALLYLQNGEKKQLESGKHFITE